MSFLMRIAPFGHLRIVVYLRLPAAFRSLSRPSSASGAKAFPLCSFLLDRLIYLYISECSSDTTFLFYCSMCFYLCLTLFLSVHVQFSRCFAPLSQRSRLLRRSGSVCESPRSPPPHTGHACQDVELVRGLPTVLSSVGAQAYHTSKDLSSGFLKNFTRPATRHLWLIFQILTVNHCSGSKNTMWNLLAVFASTQTPHHRSLKLSRAARSLLPPTQSAY